ASVAGGDAVEKETEAGVEVLVLLAGHGNDVGRMGRKADQDQMCGLCPRPDLMFVSRAKRRRGLEGGVKRGDQCLPWAASQRSASRAAMQPVPALVMAWR